MFTCQNKLYIYVNLDAATECAALRYVTTSVGIRLDDVASLHLCPAEPAAICGAAGEAQAARSRAWLRRLERRHQHLRLHQQQHPHRQHLQQQHGQRMRKLERLSVALADSGGSSATKIGKHVIIWLGRRPPPSAALGRPRRHAN